MSSSGFSLTMPGQKQVNNWDTNKITALCIFEKGHENGSTE